MTIYEGRVKNDKFKYVLTVDENEKLNLSRYKDNTNEKITFDKVKITECGHGSRVEYGMNDWKSNSSLPFKKYSDGTIDTNVWTEI